MKRLYCRAVSFKNRDHTDTSMGTQPFFTGDVELNVYGDDEIYEVCSPLKPSSDWYKSANLAMEAAVTIWQRSEAERQMQ